MRLEEAQEVLRVLTAGFPTYPVGDDTAELYVTALAARCRRYDAGMAAARQWVLEGPDRFPKIVELLRECRTQTQRLVDAEGPPALMEDTGGPLPVEENRRRLANLREQMAGMFRGPE